MVGPWGLEPQTSHGRLPQLRVLCLGLLEDGNARVGIFPKRAEVLVSGLGSCVVPNDCAHTAQLQLWHGISLPISDIPLALP
jgi:hypothetical protein